MQSLFEFSPLVVAAVPITVGLVQVTKGFVPDRLVPIASLIFGIALVALTGGTWQVDVASGIIVGLAASGLYSGAKATVATVQ